MSTVPSLTLNNGVAMPQLGFGVFQVPDAETEAAVTHALAAGYRSIDTAAIYGNEAGVGAALAAADLPREELFITTKLWNSDQGYDSALRAFDVSLDKLKLDYLDLYLIHWPAPANGRYVDSWKALTKLQADGRVRAIGVSNFQPGHLSDIVDATGVVPAVNQVELHPRLVQSEVRAAHQDLGIATEAWSPLAKGGLLDHDLLTSLATKYDRTPAQVVLRWHLQLGNIVIPKSVTPSRIKENLNVFDFDLTQDDLTAITALHDGHRTGPHPDTFNG
ncbi:MULTISPECIES: aldo/keto reductase [unclassified Crossiella]|uniref:aldo/keto reductase n=1 Tax=unclassified Crossiella TaxID=2620835 RepID=UPI001FFE3DE3|nr:MULTISPECIES: aldo/keto reductase [unclassified Crossiella]MCK2239561.1 aldo/keto reductase [Crossiella sp. S99.2]MCK2252256.1 aldo/keto reductase [Crossiella sp. S99.1]